MQLILSIVLMASCSYLGYSFGKYYQLREQFLIDLITFCQLLKSEIGFSKNNLIEIIKQKSNHYNNAFRQFLKAYVNCLQQEPYIELETLKKHMHTIYLQDIEQEQLLQFFNALGKSDLVHQVELIDQFLIFFYNFLKTAENEKKKYSGMFSKLGFLTGVFLVILLL